MIKYVLKRLLLTIPILLGVSFIIFAIMSMTPGNPAQILLGEGATPEQIDKLNAEFGYDQPFLIRYTNYMKNLIVKQDMGISWRTRANVSSEIFGRLSVSLTLASTSIILAIMIGIPIGILSAVKQYSLLDTVPTVFALMLASMPGFWLGMLLMWVFALILGVLPSGGLGTWRHFVLPTICLGLPSAATLLRYTRSSMLETIRQDYITTARSKGALERTVIWKHALKNALLPIITIIGIDFTMIMGNAVATETLFAMPGLGSQLINSIRMKDVPMVMGGVLVLAFICAVIVLIVDILYAFVDPRIKAKYAKKV